MNDKPFKFAMGSRVALIETHETEKGIVIGQARYEDTSDNFLIRYKTGDGNQVEQWWCEGAIAE